MRLPCDAALLVIDVQKAIDDPRFGARATIPARNASIADAARRLARRRPADHPHPPRFRPSAPRPIAPTPGPRLQAGGGAAAEGETVIGKSANSAFVGTALEEALDAIGATTLVVCGVLTHNSLEATVRARRQSRLSRLRRRRRLLGGGHDAISRAGAGRPRTCTRCRSPICRANMPRSSKALSRCRRPRSPICAAGCGDERLRPAARALSRTARDKRGRDPARPDLSRRRQDFRARSRRRRTTVRLVQGAQGRAGRADGRRCGPILLAALLRGERLDRPMARPHPRLGRGREPRATEPWAGRAQAAGQALGITPPFHRSSCAMRFSSRMNSSLLAADDLVELAVVRLRLGAQQPGQHVLAGHCQFQHETAPVIRPALAARRGLAARAPAAAA